MKKSPDHRIGNQSVLVITYYFPPMGGIGVLRTLKFVEYLPEFGWQPKVLTVNQINGLKDQSFLDELPNDLPIMRTPFLHLPTSLPWRLRNFITRWFLIVDEQIGWLPYAISAGLKMIAEGDIKGIYSSSTPYTTHLIARQLNKRTQLPWVADFRDPWIENPFINFPTIFHRRINERFEKQVFTDAAGVILNTESSRQHYLHKYSNLPNSKFYTIPNGFDRANMIDGNKGIQTNLSFTIVHLGSLYRRVRSIAYFLKALNRVIRQCELKPDKIRVLLIGNIDKETSSIVRQLNLDKMVEILGYLPHQQALSYLFSADLLLLIPHYGTGADLFVPAKAYEYLASHKPILCLADAGACADLVLNTQAGSVVPPTDIDKISDELIRLYTLWETDGIHFDPRIELIETFERRKLTAQLSNLFMDVFNEEC